MLPGDRVVVGSIIHGAEESPFKMSSYTSVLDSYLLGGTGKYDSLLTRSRNRALSPVRATTPNPYTSTYTSSYGRNNYDSTLNKFYNQIDQLSSYYTPSSSRSYDPPSYRSNRQTSDYSSSSYSSTLRPSSYRRYLSNETSDRYAVSEIISSFT